MKSKKFYEILSWEIIAILGLTAICLILTVVLGIVKAANPAPTPEPDRESDEVEESDAPTGNQPAPIMLEPTADAGMTYIDSMIFFGESTTSHLRARGVLSGGKNTEQVWDDASGTRTLSSKITSEKLIYPPSGQSMTIAEACAAQKPAYIVLSFGLNGLVGFIDNKASFVNNYNRLIAAITEASPTTKIILQTVYPVCQKGAFTIDVPTINQYILTLNSWLPEIAAAHSNVRVADTASVLRDNTNALYANYDNGDGIHLTASAYQQILYYLRTHAWQ